MHQAKDVIATHVTTYAPDYLLVELGFNDLGWGVNSPAGVLSDFEWFVYHARSKNPYVKIFVANVPHRSALSNNANLPALIDDYNARLAARVPEISNAFSPIRVVDVNGPYDHSGDSYDGLHPNVRGEYVIAKAFADSLAANGLGPWFGAIPTSLPAPLALTPPATITAEPDGENVKVRWAHTFGAAGYEFWSRNVTKGESFTKGVYSIGADSWSAGLLPAGHTVEFYVKPVRGGTVGAASPIARAVVAPLPKVTGVRVTTDPKKPYTATISWDPVPGAKDYHVYAAGGCDLLPPFEWSAYKLQQYNLGSKTSWTQEYITAPCVNYQVLASRYGGNGPPNDVPSRAWPYQNNFYHLLARNRYIDTAPDSSDQKAVTSVPASQDRGVVVVRGFIAATDQFTDAIGDHRGFETNPYSSSKVGVAWDTSTGDVGVYVHHSCSAGYEFPDGTVEEGCHAARPIKIVSDASIYGDDAPGDYNYVSKSLSSEGVLTLKISAVNSITDVFGRINATITLTPSGDTYSAKIVADRFPSWEIYRYPRTETAPAGSMGRTKVIGTRGQTNLLELEGSPMSTCTSRGEIEDVMNEMSCA
jgi:hypothetical protein